MKTIGLRLEVIENTRAKTTAASLPTILKQREIPEWVRLIIREVAAEYGVGMINILTSSRKFDVCRARYAAIYRVKHAKPKLTSNQIGKWFDRDQSTVFFSLARHAELTGRPPLTAYSLPGRIISSAKPNRERHR